MNLMSSADHLGKKATSNQSSVEFGFPDFWPKVYSEHKSRFDALGDLIQLGNEMIGTAEVSSSTSVQNVICALARGTVSGASEARVLCGNGCGAGAMKVVRGMFESRWIAEYLCRNPDDVQDYLDFSKVLLWRRVCWLQKSNLNHANRISPDQLKKVETDLNQVKDRFTDKAGRLRTTWSKKSIREMAEEIGQKDAYNLPYAIACSIHHANFEGLLTNFAFDDETPIPDPPPSKAWVAKSLTAAWASLWFALNTLNKACGLQYEEHLNASEQSLSSAQAHI